MSRGYEGGSQTQLRPASHHTDREKALEVARRRAAVRMVATRAIDARDCATLLDLLGLHPGEGLNP